MGFLARIRRLGSTFRPLERRLLTAVEEALGPDAAERFRQQVESVNKVQRLAAAREVNLYRMHGGKPRNPPQLAFADRRREAELATVRFQVPGEDRGRSLTLHLVDGYLFSLTFDPAAEEVLDRDDAEILNVRLMTDPTRPRQPEASPGRMDPEKLSGLLGRWHERFGLRDVGQALDDEGRRSRRREIPAHLPDAYLDLTRQAEGFTMGPWQVHGLSEVYGISLDDADYQVLAELRDEGVLGVEEGGADLWFLPFDQSPRRRVGDFKGEIEAAAQGAEVAH